jgi:hypothetical protein
MRRKKEIFLVTGQMAKVAAAAAAAVVASAVASMEGKIKEELLLGTAVVLEVMVARLAAIAAIEVTVAMPVLVLVLVGTC